MCECVCVIGQDIHAFAQTHILTLLNLAIPATHTKRYVTNDMLQNYVIIKMKEQLISAE